MKAETNFIEQIRVENWKTSNKLQLFFGLSNTTGYVRFFFSLAIYLWLSLYTERKKKQTKNDPFNYDDVLRQQNLKWLRIYFLCIRNGRELFTSFLYNVIKLMSTPQNVCVFSKKTTRKADSRISFTSASFYQVKTKRKNLFIFGTRIILFKHSKHSKTSKAQKLCAATVKCDERTNKRMNDPLNELFLALDSIFFWCFRHA